MANDPYQHLGYTDGYEMDGHPRSVNDGELHTNTVHPQQDDYEPDSIGSSTVKRIDGANYVNTPDQFDRVVPAGATVDDQGIIHL